MFVIMHFKTFEHKKLSIELEDSVYNRTEAIANILDVTHEELITTAIIHYTREKSREILSSKLEKESDKNREESIRILKEFDAIDSVDE